MRIASLKNKMTGLLKNKKGMSLIELLIVITIIGILAGVGIPQYGIFMAKSKAKKSTNDLLQNMRLARTMAIKENRPYLITINGNGYTIGFDGDSNGSLADVADGYASGPVRSVDLAAEYGTNVVLGTTSFTTAIPNGPNGIAAANAASFQFNPDGSASPSGPMGTVYVQHDSTSRGYTYCVQIANASGKTDLFLWDGDAYNSSETTWTELR